MKASIILAENEPGLRNLYEQALRGFDFEVIACSGLSDAQQAVEHAEQVDGLWMDLNLEGPPGNYRSSAVVDGFDLICAANRVSQGIPALVFSAYISDGAKEKAQRLQVFDLIAAWHSKPFDAELAGFDLVRAVNISFWRRKVLPELKKDLAGDTEELATLRRNVIRTADPYKLVFPRDRKGFERKLLDKMAELFRDVEMRSRQNDGEAAYHSQACAFTLAANHLPACFEMASPNHEILVEHLIYITRAFGNRPLIADAARQLIMASEELGREDLSEETVFELKSCLSKTLGVASMGPLLGSSREEVMGILFGDAREEN
jgi:CheY-like chemotaxis protein